MRFQTDRHFNQFSTALSFRPTQLPGLVLWTRADLGITIATGVSAWTDQSGTGNNLAQPTGANQPAFTASVAALGARPALTYSTTQWIFRDPFVGVLTQPYTVAAVWNLTDNSGTRRLYDGNAGGRDQCFTGVNNYVIGAGTNISATVTPNTGGHYSIGVYNGASGTVAVDTVNLGAGAVGAANAGAMYVGSDFTGGANWIGDIAEVMMYSRALTAAEQTQLNAYFKARYRL